MDESMLKIELIDFDHHSISTSNSNQLTVCIGQALYRTFEGVMNDL